ncbi:MAG: bifunctional diaminohydroxyphosphoribosylaminopyrimidine deaminase/5-amino-6-(5-phosphoribosylamino)uracil reductase RibD [Cyclobacteriaceae bacterium]|nr:bifunctional diaminohydroxyphosphoribosylaminopyrimidine deaminase/5-amino-6-(5-phosphoribosylamino)uracil reductase RibD [Cyclobacteriaceae bacterium]
MESQQELFMQRALELAARGTGRVAPNPLVGCVIVKNDKIIAEGWHQYHGGMHAEIMALSKIKNQKDLQDADIYVSLEPCSHQGLTPPCAPRLASLPINTVYISSVDPNPKVQGKGIEILQNAGKTVVVGILEAESRKLNHKFFTFHEKKRPYILLKWAQTADKYIAKANNDSKWISNKLSRKIVHKWRGECAGILVGTTTAEKDDPKLNTREWAGKDPVRIIIDRKLSLSPDLTIYKDEGRTLTYNLKENRIEGNKEFIMVQQFQFISEIMKDLYEKGVQSVLVEGGATIHRAFIEEGIWDECRIFQSTNLFGEGISAPEIPGVISYSEKIMNNTLFIIENNNNG